MTNIANSETVTFLYFKQETDQRIQGGRIIAFSGASDWSKMKEP